MDRRSFLLAPDGQVEERPEEADQHDDQAPHQLAVTADATLGLEQVPQGDHEQDELDHDDRGEQDQQLRVGHRRRLPRVAAATMRRVLPARQTRRPSTPAPRPSSGDDRASVPSAGGLAVGRRTGPRIPSVRGDRDLDRSIATRLDRANQGDPRTMFASTDPYYLPLVVIDTSDLRSDRRRAALIDEDEIVVPRVPRRSRLVASATANLGRLIPGGTHRPYEPVSR